MQYVPEKQIFDNLDDCFAQNQGPACPIYQQHEVDERGFKKEGFLEAAKPLIKWLNENCHPHVVVHVYGDGAELFEGQFNAKTDEFIKD